MTETKVDEQGRPEPTGRADAAQTLQQFLEYQRATLAWKCRGLSDEQLRTHLHPTTMTLAGLLAHMATVEDYWFTRCVAHEPFPVDAYPQPFDEQDWEWEWTRATQLPGDDLRALWAGACERSRAVLERALPYGIETAPPVEEAPNLAWVLTHMVEEYARHNGHADLLREAIDGQTGE